MFPLKEVLPVPFASAEVRRARRTELSAADARKRRELQPYVDLIEDFLGQQENRMASARAIYRETVAKEVLVEGLRAVGAATQNPLRTLTQIFPETLDTYGANIRLVD